MTTKIKDLETIIEIQEKIIKANKKENDILSDCLKKSYEREDNMKQWAFWYRAFSEYLERCIQVFIETKRKTIFTPYLNTLKNPRVQESQKQLGTLKFNPFIQGDANLRSKGKKIKKYVRVK
jgi:hypothetical protein